MRVVVRWVRGTGRRTRRIVWSVLGFLAAVGALGAARVVEAVENLPDAPPAPARRSSEEGIPSRNCQIIAPATP